MRSVGCGALLIASCAGCCCGRIPTFGLWPEVDEASVRAAIEREPLVVDHLCTTEKHCAVVRGAEVAATPVGWNPITGNVVTLIEVEATCEPVQDPLERAAPFVCAGLLAGVGVAGGTLVVDEVSGWAFTALPPSGIARHLPGEPVEDVDLDFDWD